MSSTEQAGVDPTASDIYNETYYAHHLGLPYERNDHWLGFFGRVADRIIAGIAPQTSLDVGCAFGFLVEALRDRGVDAKGTDVSDYAISQVGGSAVGHCSVVSGLEPIEGRYDLISCVEVIEHISAEDGRTLVANMAAATDKILLSSTPYDFAEPTHINVQPVEYWAELLAEVGFYRDVDHDASYLTSWAGLFVKRDLTPSAVVRDYERSEFRVREEVVELRRAIQEQYAQIGQLESQVSSLREDLAASEETDGRNSRLQQELLRARDAAAGAEAAAGEAKAEAERLRGELMAAYAHQQHWDQLVEGMEQRLDVQENNEVIAELERTKQRLAAVEESTTWRVGYGVMAPYRRVRGQ